MEKKIRFLCEITFYSGVRATLPSCGYRPDAVFEGHQGAYWGITFTQLSDGNFDSPILAEFMFTFQQKHAEEVEIGQTFQIMEGALQVGEGNIIAIDLE